MLNLNLELPKKLVLATAIVLPLLSVSVAQADDVTDSMDEASKAYADGDMAATLESLNYAIQLLQQMKAEGVKSLLPEVPDGWTAEEAESTAVGTAMFGGGITAERRYTKGDSSVSIQIVTDSPMLQGMMMLFTNPAFAASSGGKMEKIGKQKIISTYDAGKKGGDYKIMVANRYLVTVTGEQVSKDEMTAFVEAMDFSKFE